MSVMSEKTLRVAVDDWEREANKLIEQTREVGSWPRRTSRNKLKQPRWKA